MADRYVITNGFYRWEIEDEFSNEEAALKAAQKYVQNKGGSVSVFKQIACVQAVAQIQRD
jgi:hypothetical protein